MHVIGPENGATLPGMTVVCGDSHTSTHGAFGCLAFGIGTSEVEHVLATQCLLTKQSKAMLVRVDGALPFGCTAKDIALAVIGKIGTAGGSGYAIEFGGAAIDALSMEGRMTVCNMSIEAGARAGMIAVDDKTIAYLRGRPFAPTGEMWDRAVAYWRTLVVRCRREIRPRRRHRCGDDRPAGDLGHVAGNGDDDRRPRARSRTRSAIRCVATASSARCRTWDSRRTRAMTDIRIDKVFIGSCTNSRIEDLRAAAAVVSGRHKADNVKLAMVVPGSGLVKAQAEREGLDRVFTRGGLRMARARLLDVPGDERRPAGARRALRVDVEPQFRRPPGHRRPHASGQSGDGRRRGDRRAFRRRASTFLKERDRCSRFAS